MAITPDGTRAYVTNGLGDSVSVIDTATNAVIGDPIPVCISRSGGGAVFCVQADRPRLSFSTDPRVETALRGQA
ncbi:hypothetical protein [Rhodococcus jostii]|uniref:hypothetical protein n=1 Tax=Rhodococcus jostii TaxID=132919 RepID=UPI003634B9F4